MKSRALILAASLHLCRALHSGFSIHEDMLAHPQFEVVFSESYILDRDVQSYLANAKRADATASTEAAATPHADAEAASREASAVDHPKQPSASAHASGSSSKYGDGHVGGQGLRVSETYEIMHVPPSRYFCSIPILAAPPSPNQTATALARAEEARELSRASMRGTDIIKTMEGECLYYMAGWWSYRFCYGADIVQFHARTTKAGKPVREEYTPEYVLGRMLSLDDPSATRAQRQQQRRAQDRQATLDGTSGGNDAYKTELQTKGDQRYMVQRLGAGTVCDLTGRDRTIEIQYHCNPGSTSDRIGWIKEATTCAYLMEIQTPRLCAEAAFLPPKPKPAHPISCRRIISSDEEAAAWHRQKTVEAHEAMRAPPQKEEQSTEPPQERQDQDQTQPEQQQQQSVYGAAAELPADRSGVVVGGVVIGARQALGAGDDGQPAVLLEPPRGYSGGGAAARPFGGRVVAVIAKAAKASDGGAVQVLSDEELARLDLKPDVIQELCNKLLAIAGGKAWRLEAVEVAGEAELEIRATLEPAEADEDAGNGKADAQDPAVRGGSDGEEPEGSKETFKKDEL